MPTGGQWNFAGILFQLLATLRSGVTAAVSEVHEGRHTLSVRLIAEPASGGDATTLTGRHRQVDQMKIRRGQKGWTLREMVENVLPDLFKAHDQAGPPTDFRFVTDNLAGTKALAGFLKEVRAVRARELGPAGLEPNARRFRWGQQRVSASELFVKIAAHLAPDDSAAAWDFLGAVEIVGCSEVAAIAQIDTLIGKMADDLSEVRTRRMALCTALLELGKAGEAVDLAALFRSVRLEPDKLTIERDLSALLRTDVEREAALRQYDRAMDVRAAPDLPAAPLVLLSGDSGQGKTWRLCQAALRHGEDGGCGILLPATGTVPEIEQAIVDLVWRNRFGGTASLARVAELLGPRLANETGVWLTVYLDDLADAELAHGLARLPWQRWGIRMVVTAQDRIAQLLGNAVPALAEISVPDFTLPELRDYLTRAGRDPRFLPDDVLMSLLRPVLASIFCRIPESATWTAVTEYTLMDEYWRWATTIHRSQPIHRSDGAAVVALAGAVLDGPALYPWPPSLVAQPLLDAGTRDRLITNGVLREDAEGALEMSHSRLLNWVVALEITRRFLEGELDLQGVADQLGKLDQITTPLGDRIGQRLGYVLHDLFWMLARRARPEEVGALALLVVRGGVASNDHEHFFTAGLGSLGAPIAPALAWMARQTYPEKERLLPRHIAAALVAVSEVAADTVRTIAGALIDENGAHTHQVALQIMRRLAVPSALDNLWELNQARGRALDAARGDSNWGGYYHDKQQSYAALARAVTANPDWLARKAAAITEGDDATQALWLLIDLDLAVARPIWQAHKANLLDRAPADGNAAPRAIRHFLDREEIARVENALAASSEIVTALWFDTLARLDPEAAVEALYRLKPGDLCGTSHWWLPGLVHRTGEKARDAVRATLGEQRYQGDPVLMTLTHAYQSAPEVLDARTFDKLLDNYEECLAADAAGTTDGKITRRHLRAVIASVNAPALLERLAARAGGRLEALLLEKARARSGRTSMYRDSDGEEYHLILAAIGGSGYDDLVLAELERPNVHGRTDGVTAARWTRNSAVTAKLEEIARDPDDDTYRRVMLMESLAAHHADEGLTAMIRHGAPLIVRAVDIREHGPPWSNESIAAVRGLLADPDPAERLVGVNLCAFLPEPIAGDLLAPILADPAASEDEVSLTVGVLAQLEHYRPDFLERIAPRLALKDGGILAANYLAWSGDEAARRVVADWLERNPLNELNSAVLPIAFRLLAFGDSEAAGRQFLRRVLDKGLGFGNEGELWAILASAGDNEASEALQAIAYQKPRRGADSVIAATKALAQSVPEEAQAAAERFFRRDRNIAAAALLIELDTETGLSAVLDEYQDAPATTQDALGRLMRSAVPSARLADSIADLASSDDVKERLVAAELGAWLPAETPCPALTRLADDESYDVEKAALSALVRRRADAEAAEIIARIETQPRPRQWAWLHALVRLADPAHLANPRDPRSIHALLGRLGEDFREEANKALEKRRKDLFKDAEKRDKNRD
ncbi:hypothetical protein [Novosphingobium sp. BW1]|uniref:hypothetical protein n=1 Tax=Novosphingobium sp. BW1 TaxID=2592621 RepID=UPI0011DE8797|nr:hypothetical protein [Novosphingobium sp. BW1]TYC83789.1 hypothetical protein FMM79_19140 [Novosphingobium sp. BW1]